MVATGRLTWWNSGTDGESPDGRQHAGRPTTAGRARVRRRTAAPGVRRRRPGEPPERARAEQEHRWAADQRDERRAPRHAPRRGPVRVGRRGHPPQPHRRRASSSTGPARSSARAGTSGPAGRTPRSSRWPTPATGPAAAPRRHPRAVRAHRPHRAVHRRADRRRRRPGRLRRRRPDPGRGRGRATCCAPPASRSRPGLLADEAERGQRALADRRTRCGRPFVVWKVAATLDGRVAAADGTSRWISSPESRADAHRLRAECDAIVAGVGTVLADDPALTVRDAAGALVGEQPLRVVVDTHGRTPAGARVRDASAPTWVATAAELGTDAAGQVDLAALLRALHAKGRGAGAARGRPDAGRGVRAGRPGRPGGRLPGAHPARRRRRRRSPAPASAPSPTACALDVTDVTRCGPDVRVTARPAARRQRGRADVHRHRRGARRGGRARPTWATASG